MKEKQFVPEHPQTLDETKQCSVHPHAKEPLSAVASNTSGVEYVWESRNCQCRRSLTGNSTRRGTSELKRDMIIETEGSLKSAPS
jgi:hypothetical protein